jgi:hypothetical protein
LDCGDGNVHSAKDWRAVLEPVVARYQGRNFPLYFRADAAFAQPELYARDPLLFCHGRMQIHNFVGLEEWSFAWLFGLLGCNLPLGRSPEVFATVSLPAAARNP